MKKTTIMVLIVFALIIYGCQSYDIKNSECNDNNPCTMDSFDSGSCKHEDKKCQESQECNINTGDCEALDVMDKIENAIKEKLKE